MNGEGEDRQGRLRPFLSFTHLVMAAIYWSAVAIFIAVLSALFAALFVNVVLRYAFNEGIAWAYEIPSILFPWAVASAIVIAAVLGRNIQIALLAGLLPPGARRLVGVCVYAATVAICAVVVWTSMPTLKAAQFMRLAETGIPQIWGMSSLVYAFVAVALVSAIDAMRLMAGDDYLKDGLDRSLS